MPSSTTVEMTAPQRVLSIPELLGEIFEWIALKENPKHRSQPWICHCNGPCKCPNNTTLRRCALVNHLWFQEAMRLLWERPGKPNANPFSRIPPARRQIYANFVKIFCLSLRLRHHRWLGKQKKVLRDITFPNATIAYIYAFPGLDKLEVPPFRAPALKTLYLLMQDLWYSFDRDSEIPYKLARRIKTLFPTLKRLVIADVSFLATRCAQIMPEQLPGVDVSSDADLDFELHY
ncbi:uncharacterized protein N7496_002308 [Penicillium cataractarum]|uniref:Uncharacterized protein n=1 Tax=Penicillium cataractarum TaxID=2100454 RepID=A0A9W9SK48_9EURO|nr:uncharacterized protein N7496_002308 [Penicillium cataractarum]KAJ5379880.1 hypothetical protein N7496_002308 [Penicillium cataractarum]